MKAERGVPVRLLRRAGKWFCTFDLAVLRHPLTLTLMAGVGAPAILAYLGLSK